MAQTTDALSFSVHYVGFSTDNVTYTDVSGYSNSVSLSGFERVVGYGYTADGDIGIQKRGKKQPGTVTVRVVYTEVADKAYDMGKDAYDTSGGTDFYIRWSPGGGDAGDLGFTSTAGTVIGNPYPQGDVESGEPIFVEIMLACADIDESTIGTAGWT
jgi:hypothetical protein